MQNNGRKRTRYGAGRARYILLVLLWLGMSAPGHGQTVLLFKKNNRREAYYKAGDVLTFNVRGHDGKLSEPILGFEDSLVIFPYLKIRPSEITHLYVDDKTKIWYIIRYKYEKLFLLSGAVFPTLDALNSGQVRPDALLIGGSLLGAGVLAKLLISKRLKVKGRRHFVIITY